MSRGRKGPFCWDYPAGAEDDPRASHNQIYDEECGNCGLPVEPRNNEESCECDDDEQAMVYRG